MRPSRHDVLMNIAALFALRSTCLRGNVGAVLARDGRVLTTGYNGTPSGMEHCTPFTCDPDGPRCLRSVHAEANCIAFAARHGISTEGAVLYCTHSPCLDCAKLIVNAGIVQLFYNQEYHHQAGLEILVRSGVVVEKSELRALSITPLV